MVERFKQEQTIQGYSKAVVWSWLPPKSVPPPADGIEALKRRVGMQRLADTVMRTNAELKSVGKRNG